MSVTEFLINRVSSPKLKAPAPSQEVLDQCYQAALRAPDHGRIKPWRFIQIEGESLKKLGQLYYDAENFDAVKNQGNEISDVRRDKLLSMPLRAPLIVTVVANVQSHPKVPREEQLMAAACATYGLSLSLSDHGFGYMWRTGSLAYHQIVKNGLGLSDQEEIVGFLYVGTPETAPKPAKHDQISDFVEKF